MLSRAQNLKHAEEQKKKDRLLGPGYFFFPVKTTLNSINAYREAEVFSYQQLKEYISRWAKKLNVSFPVIAVQKKYDGVSCILHRRKDGKLFVFTDNGKEVTNKFQFFFDHLPEREHDYIIQGEVVGWVNGKHLGREEVAGLLNSKTDDPLLKKLTWCIYDVVWFDGQDLHKRSYKERYTLLKEKFDFEYSLLTRYKPGFNLAPTFVCSSFSSLKKAIEVVAEPPESEGAMLKLWDGFEYNLNGSTADIIKFKKYAEAHFIVLSKRLIKGAKRTYAYEIGVLVLPSERERVQEKYLRSLPGHKDSYLYVGKTFNTNVDAKVGDVLTVKFHNLFVHYDKDHKMRLGIYEPRVYENRSRANVNERPDTVTSLIHIGEESNLLVEKGGLGVYTQKSTDIFLDFAPAGTRYPFIIHVHIRGRTAHGDLRIVHPSRSFLVGWTLLIQTPGTIKEPVLTVSQAQKLLSDSKIWKFNPVNGEFAERVTRSGVRRLASIESVMKKPEPLEWLSVQGVAKPGSPGSTKNYPGVFVIAARGQCEYGFQAPHFHEYFFYCDRWKDKGARLVFRLLGSEFSIKDICDLIGSESDEVFVFLPEGYEIDRTGSFCYKVLPPAEEQEVRSSAVWLMIKSKDLVPYVLSKRAVEKGRIPPYGASALPHKIEKQIPKELRFWMVRDRERARKVRDELVDSLRKLKIKFDNSIFKALVGKKSEEKGEKGEFVLKHRFWRGQHVVRWGLSEEFWDLYCEYDSNIIRFECFNDPCVSDSFASKLYTASKAEMDYEGGIPPKSKLNPNKELVAQTEKVCQGVVVVEEDKRTKKVFDFESKKLSGRFSFEKDEGTDIWVCNRIN